MNYLRLKVLPVSYYGTGAGTLDSLLNLWEDIHTQH